MSAKVQKPSIKLDEQANGMNTTAANNGVSKSTNANGQKKTKTLAEKLAESEAKIKAIEAETQAEIQAKNAHIEQLEKHAKNAKPLNVVEALIRVSDSKAIADRLEFLRDTRKELSTFTLGKDGLNDELIIRDGERNSFVSHNTNTIKLVLEMLKTELDRKILETEAELMAIV